MNPDWQNFLTQHGATIDAGVVQRFTAYNRLEPRPRTENFERSLRTEVHDGLWMLTRQWQMGELESEDAGSAIDARLLTKQFQIDNKVLHENAAKQYDAQIGDTAAELVATAQGTVLCDLSQFGVLKVAGEDAQSFLQNLLSSDVREVSEQRAQGSSLNSPKGRMQATFLIWRTGADYFLHLPRTLCPGIQKKLSMYVLRAKVKISDVSDEIICLGLSGAGAAALLQQHSGSVPQDLLAVEQHGNASVIRAGAQRFQINTTPQHAPALWQSLSAVARPAGSPCWDWLNIRDGIPVIMPATQEQFVPQMANLDLIGGVNFKKGCYPGQEIVARMQYLGKIKRRMYLAHIEGNTIPQPGDELYSAEMEGQASGMVVNATAAPGGGCDLLAAVQISSRETQTVHLQSLQGAVLNFLPLPYPIP